MSAKVDKTGSCSFCGQAKIIQVPEEWEQGQINEAVTCECECEQAQAYAKAKERKDKAKKRINELFGSGAEKQRFLKWRKKVLRLNGRRTKRQPTKNSGLGGQYCKELMMILKPQ